MRVSWIYFYITETLYQVYLNGLINYIGALHVYTNIGPFMINATMVTCTRRVEHDFTTQQMLT